MPSPIILVTVPEMVERVFGVTHGAHIDYLWGLASRELPVYPSQELIEILSQLPRGTVVGIETTPSGALAATPDGAEFGIPPEQTAYWDRVVEVCKNLGHKIAFLDDPDTYMRYAEKLAEQRRIGLQLQSIPHIENNRPQAQPLVEAHYRAGVEAEYIHTVIREQRIHDNILELTPQVVIIGIGHTDYIMINNPLLNSNGKPAVYRRETAEVLAAMEEYAAAISHLVDDQPNPKTLLERELLERRYRAVTEGRVTTETPQFIGTWNTWCRPEGLFEVHMASQNHGETLATIEDCLGTATAVIRQNGDVLTIIKTYDPKRSGVNHNYPISYQGHKVGDKYTGSYIIDGGRGEGEFEMQPFLPQPSRNPNFFQ